MVGVRRSCTQGPWAAHDSGPRRASEIRWAVIHSAEASDDVGEDRSAEGVASYFARDDVKASTQLAVDRDSCVRMLSDLVIPWGAKGANRHGVHVEICGRASWSRAEWLTRDVMLRRAAFKVARWCYAYKIPARWVGPAGLKLGRKGLTQHRDVERAWPSSGHWDPGPFFPKDVFLAYVKAYLAEIRASRR